MRFAFREVPDPASRSVRPRPIIDVIVEGLEVAPQACLIDSGATAVRLGIHVAELCGVDLEGAEERQLAAGGHLVTARMAPVTLRVDDGTSEYSWEAPVWFCEPWTPAFGLLGLTGFFDHFEVTISSYAEVVELNPIS